MGSEVRVFQGTFKRVENIVDKTYKIIGYGSLVSHKSLKEDCKDKKFIPVIIKGYTRIFDIKDKKGDVLNIKKDKNGHFNGVLFEVDKEELKKLKKRENGYKTRKIDFIQFNNRKIKGSALTFIDLHFLIDHKKNLPDKKYLLMCREAAYHISKKFGLMWDNTTFTSDGKKVKEYIKNQKVHLN